MRMAYGLVIGVLWLVPGAVWGESAGAERRVLVAARYDACSARSPAGPKAGIEWMEAEVSDLMAKAIAVDVPIKVNAAWGENWMEGKKGLGPAAWVAADHWGGQRCIEAAGTRRERRVTFACGEPSVVKCWPCIGSPGARWDGDSGKVECPLSFLSVHNPVGVMADCS